MTLYYSFFDCILKQDIESKSELIKTDIRKQKLWIFTCVDQSEFGYKNCI